ncbi:MAG: DUF3343 domain-containing protein [Firmicutes bacterium]|nr:DUF3343 domain-containing protein [Bacillota bacterium]
MTAKTDLFVITFYSTYWAFEAETLLQEHGFQCRLRPVPREFSSSCGICAEVLAEDMESILALLEEQGLEYDATYGPLKGR